MQYTIRNIISNSIWIKQKLIQNDFVIAEIEQAVNCIVKTYKNNGKVLFCGNGGSAADAQHLAAELSGRFYFDREPLAAEALHSNTSFLTAVSNDYSYDEVYSRYVKGFGKEGDVIIGISTSGKSKNVCKALETANNLKMITIALTGESGGDMKNIAQICINVPSNDTPRIQESHIMIGHIICQMVEEIIFKTNQFK